MRAATALRPDVVFGPYASGPAVAAMRATDRLVWNHGGATDRLSLPEFAHTVNIPAPASSYFANVLQSLHAADPTLLEVSLLHVQTGFGREVARGAVQTAKDLGLEVRTLAFEPGQAAESARLLPRGDVLLVAGPFADELVAARLLLQRPWRAAGFVGAGVEEVLAPLGALRDGLIGPCQWLVHAALPPDDGPDDAALRAAAARLQLRTLFGSFRIDPRSGLQVGHQVLVVQWQEGTRRVVWPPERAERLGCARIQEITVLTPG